MTFGYFGGPDCETCGGYYPGNPNAMPSHFCDCKPAWQKAEELYSGRCEVYFREVRSDGTWEAYGKFVCDPSHEWYAHVKKLAHEPAVTFVSSKDNIVTVCRMPVSELERLFDDDE